MLPTLMGAPPSNQCGVCDRRHATPAFEYLDYVARSQRDAAIVNRTPLQLSFLQLVLSTPHRALRAEHLIDAGMPPRGAADLVSRLFSYPDGELQRRIQATPTLRAWFDQATLPSSNGPDNDSLILSLRVLQLFAHATSVPIVFDPTHRTVTLYYAPGRSHTDGRVSADGAIALALHDAAESRDADLSGASLSRNALHLLVLTNDIDGQPQHSPFWQRDSDYWWHGADTVRAITLPLSAEFETWLEARCDSAVSRRAFHTFGVIHGEQLPPA